MVKNAIGRATLGAKAGNGRAWLSRLPSILLSFDEGTVPISPQQGGNRELEI